MAKQRGGWREGAGRKAGGKNRRTIAAEAMREEILSEGESPLEVMIGSMRTALKRAATLESDLRKFAVDPGMNTDRLKALAELHAEARRYLTAAHSCAVDAAPYLHPRLASVDVGNADGVPFEVNVTEFEFARRIAMLLTNAAGDLAQSGATEPEQRRH